MDVSISFHIGKQFVLQDVFSLLVCLVFLVSLIVLPTHTCIALPTRYVPDEMPSGRHAPLLLFSFAHIGDAIEKIGLAKLAAERLFMSPCVESAAWTLSPLTLNLRARQDVCDISCSHRPCRLQGIY